MYLLKELKPYLINDEFGGTSGIYTVSSIYFDTPDNLFYNETMNRQRFRQKLRLRIYNKCNGDDTAYFEIKSKYNGFVRKRRTAMKLRDAERFIDTSIDKRLAALDSFDCSNRQILKEVSFLMDFYNLFPRVVVSYERQALISKNDRDLRLTFDMDIRTRDSGLELENGSSGSPVVDSDVVVMEVKSEKNLPLWLTSAISRFGCKNQSFSKYCSHYKRRLDVECILSGLKM